MAESPTSVQQNAGWFHLRSLKDRTTFYTSHL